MKELKNISINIFDGKIEEILPFVDLLYVELFGEKFKLDEPFKTELIKNELRKLNERLKKTTLNI